MIQKHESYGTWTNTLFHCTIYDTWYDTVLDLGLYFTDLKIHAIQGIYNYTVFDL
jgi:hypothetical protein